MHYESGQGDPMVEYRWKSRDLCRREYAGRVLSPFRVDKHIAYDIISGPGAQKKDFRYSERK